ncbi:MAG: archaeosine biosynthesis radical SAM protein RaSEA [Candidatus Thermoplasmatota archaeon]|jgi:hypothetical protein|nr:archaeosine biosynthesis radical SAM protein RaSEA [Candidatus Thermoplasmatota archaeon]
MSQEDEIPRKTNGQTTGVPQGRRPRSLWREKDSLKGSIVDSMVVILEGPGCSHALSGGCTMCGYNSGPRPSPDEVCLSEQVIWVLNELRSEPYLKVFTSGSFLDGNEIPMRSAMELLKGVNSQSPGTKVLIESRPEFITDRSLMMVKNAHDDVEIAIGLETSSDKVRGSLIQKGFSWKDYVRAGNLVIENGFELKTYLLLKPPFLGEYQAYHDVMNSISDVSRTFPGSRISVNPINIQSGTSLEGLYHQGLYRPPWLRTVVKVLAEAKGMVPQGTHLMSCPTAGGRKRGAHNCGECDGAFLSLIERFSLDNTSPLVLPPIECCREDWLHEMGTSMIFPLKDG